MFVANSRHVFYRSFSFRQATRDLKNDLSVAQMFDLRQIGVLMEIVDFSSERSGHGSTS